MEARTLFETQNLRTADSLYSGEQDADDGAPWLMSPGGRSDPQVAVEAAEGVAHDVQLVPELLHHAVDAGRVLQHVHALGVRVVADGEGTPHGLGKLSATRVSDRLAKFNPGL